MSRMLCVLLGIAAIAVSGQPEAGFKIPPVELHKGFPPEKINLAEYIAGRKVIIVGLPGAFTPT